MQTAKKLAAAAAANSAFRVSLHRVRHASERAALEGLLKLVPTRDLMPLYAPRTATKWHYVYAVGGRFVGRYGRSNLTQAWEDPPLCAAEIWVLANLHQPIGVQYVNIFQALLPNAVNLSHYTPPPKPVSTPPPELVLEDPKDNPLDAVVEDLRQSVREATARMQEAARRRDFEEVTAEQRVIAALGDTITSILNGITERPSRGADPRLLNQGSGPANPVPAQALVVAPTVHQIAPPMPDQTPPHNDSLSVGATPAKRLEVEHLHAKATKAARDEYVNVLAGRDRDAPSQVKKLPPSVDYALVRGLMAYWATWITARMKAVYGEDFVPDTFAIEDSVFAAEARKLMAAGIPGDFLFRPDDPTIPLYDPNDPTNVPLTGFPTTPDAAAHLILLRPPTWVQTWTPPPEGPFRADGDPTLDLFCGYDPVQTQATGEITKLPIPTHLTDPRFPALTVPEAFITWTLASAAAMKSIPLSDIPYLSRTIAAQRIRAYSGLDRALGLNSPLEDWQDARRLWDQRKALGEPWHEILADLGPPPERPSEAETPDWLTYLPKLKTVAIRYMPFVMRWLSLPEKIHHDPMASANPLRVDDIVRGEIAGPIDVDEPTALATPDDIPPAPVPWDPGSAPWG